MPASPGSKRRAKPPSPHPVLGLACWAAVGLATALSESGEALCGGLKVPRSC